MSQQLLFGTLIGICALGILTQAIIIMRSNRRTNKWKGRQVIAIVLLGGAPGILLLNGLTTEQD